MAVKELPDISAVKELPDEPSSQPAVKELPDHPQVSETPEQSFKPESVGGEQSGGFMDAMKTALQQNRLGEPAVSDVSPDVIKNSPFEAIHRFSAELSDASRGIHVDVPQFDKNDLFKTPDSPLTFSRYVDKSGNPVEADDVHSGKISPDEIDTEPVMDHFFPGFKGTGKQPPIYKDELVNQAVAKSISEGTPGPIDALKSWAVGTKELVSDPHNSGIYRYFFGPITEGEQFVARQSVSALAQAGKMPPEDARRLLSQEELHIHDITDFYGVDTASGATARFKLAASGFLGDIMADPLQMVGTVQKIGAEGAMIGGRLVTDLGQVSKFEATHFRLGQDLENIITKDGELLRGNGELHYDESNLRALDRWKQQKTPMNFADLQSHLKLSPEAMQSAEAAKDMRMSGSSVLQQIASGERQLTMKIPMTNYAIPVFSDMAESGGQMAAETLLKLKNGMGRGLDSANRFVAAQGVLGKGLTDGIAKAAESGSWLANQIGTLATETGRPLFNGAARIFMNDQSYARYTMNEFKNTWYKAFQDAEGKIDGKPLKEVMDLLDIEPQRPDEYYLKQNGASPWANPEDFKSSKEMHSDKISSLRENYRYAKEQSINGKPAEIQDWMKDTAPEMYADQVGKHRDFWKNEAASRLKSLESAMADGNDFTPVFPSDAKQRLLDIRSTAAQMRSTMSASQLKLVDTIQKQNIQMVDEFKKRGIEFFENNPLQEGNNATGYIKHMVTQEYLSQYKNEDEAIKAASEYASSRMPGFDGSRMQRAIKDPISVVNKRYAEANNGIKMFVEDPIAAHTARMKQMQDQLRNHDMFHTLDDLMIYKKASEEPIPKGSGFVNLNPDIGKSSMVFKDADGVARDNYTNFLPNKMKNWLDFGHSVYLPEDVNTRLEYMLNPHANAGVLSGIMNNGAMKMSNYLFKNSALFGTGYLGMRAMSHMNTAIYSGTDLTKMFDALRVITPVAGEEEKFLVSGVQMTKTQLFDQAVQDGVLHTGFMSQDDWGHMVENIASTSRQRDSLLKGPATVFDHAMGFSLNRAISSGIDDTGKLAHYLTKLEQGYTRAGAAESAAFWFYDYGVQTPAQKAFSTIIPFSSTGIKTMEQTLNSLKELNVAHLTLPQKVNSVLSGNYISSPEERQFISETVPNFMKSNIYGPMLPGGRELMMEFPWVYHTMNAFMSPFTSERNDLSSMPVNPLLKVIGMGLVAAKSNSMTEFTDEMSAKEFATEMASSYLPPLFKSSLAMYQILHPEEQQGLIDFTKWYVPKGAFAPTKSNDSQTNQKFANAVEFGRWVEKEYGGNAFVNLFTHGTPEDPSSPVSSSADNIHEKYYSPRADAISAGLGNYVRSQMRNITFGLSRATPMDVDFFSRDSALNKQSKAMQLELTTLNTKLNMGLEITGAPFDPKYREKVLSYGTDEQKSLMSKIDAIEDKRDHLHAFYGQVLQDDKEKTGIFRQIFGIEPNKINFEHIQGGVESLNAKVNAKKLLEQNQE